MAGVLIFMEDGIGTVHIGCGYPMIPLDGVHIITEDGTGDQDLVGTGFPRAHGDLPGFYGLSLATVLDGLRSGMVDMIPTTIDTTIVTTTVTAIVKLGHLSIEINFKAEMLLNTLYIRMN